MGLNFDNRKFVPHLKVLTFFTKCGNVQKQLAGQKSNFGVQNEKLHLLIS